MGYNSFVAALLLKLQGNRSFNRTLFPPRLYLYNNRLAWRKGHFFKIREFSIPYNQISQVNISNGIIFSEMHILTTGVENIKIRYIPKWHAKKGKKIIDQKMYEAHYGDKDKKNDDQGQYSNIIKDFEKGVSRLFELKNAKKITMREFNKKRKQLLKKIK